MTMLGTSLIAASGCASKSGTGTATGAVAGGVLGGALGGTKGALIGAAAGGVLGYGIGESMEEQDRQRMIYAFEEDRPVEWRNPETGYRYHVEPRETVIRSGRQCREFRMLADVGREPEEVNGVACRAPDGRWELMSG